MTLNFPDMRQRSTGLLKSGWFWFAVTLLIFILSIGGRKPTLDVIPGALTVRDSVVVHHTDTVKIPGKSIVVFRTPIKTDSIKADVVDTQVCYSTSKAFERGAAVTIDMCSKFLPAQKPADLSAKIIYIPPIESIRIERRTDSIPKIIYKPPVIATWKAILVGVGVGALGALILKK
jgi:hypothetical protein